MSKNVADLTNTATIRIEGYRKQWHLKLAW